MSFVNPFTYKTGTAWYLVGVIFWGVLATLFAVLLVRRHRRGRANLRASLPPEQFAKIELDVTMHYVIWIVRAFQVAIAGVFGGVSLGLLSFPTDKRWITTVFVYIAILFMLEPFLWFVIGCTEWWLGRKSRWR